MAHETAHAYANRLTRFIPFSSNKIKTGLSDGRLDTIEHIAIKKLENAYYNINLNGINTKGLNIIPTSNLNNLLKGLSPVMQSHVNSWYDKFFDIFNRRVTYKGIVW